MTTSDNIAAIEKALKLGIAYDNLLRKYEGPQEILFDGDVVAIDDAYDAWVVAVRSASAVLPDVLAEARKAEREIAGLRAQIGYWQRGHELIEECLAKCVKADPLDAPFPLIGTEVKQWHAYRGEAFRHALEMMGVPEMSRARTLLNGGSDAQQG